MPQAIADALRSGTVLADHSFDRLFPARHRFRSWLHWTPVDVAVRACAMLAAQRASRVLDVGAGVGKLCLVGALTTPARWFGIESDAEMVEAARAAAIKLRVQARVEFALGDATASDWSAFDAFYLFNPFGEHLFRGSDGESSPRRIFASYIELAQCRLADAGPGTRVVTYNGLGGGAMPRGYDLIRREPAHDDELILWVKRARRPRPLLEPA